MRATITINVTAPTVRTTLQKLLVEWRRIVGDETASLPTDAEIFMDGDSDTQGVYRAKFTARTKLDTTGVVNE